ncbi:cyclin family protein [Pelomyxa schiedti]|nr:cyclin family protein [Pelomyxa schiedti]
MLSFETHTLLSHPASSKDIRAPISKNAQAFKPTNACSCSSPSSSSTNYGNGDTSFAQGLSELLTRIVEASRNQSNSVSGIHYPGPPKGTMTVFDGARCKPPSISLQDFTARIERYSGCTRATVIAALVYLDRLLVKHPFITLTETNVHRLLWTCLVVAIKNFEDNFYSNLHYSKVGGVSLPEMNNLEITLLLALGFDLFIESKQFDQYDAALAASCDFAKKAKEVTTTQATPHLVSTHTPESGPRYQVRYQYTASPVSSGIVGPTRL